MPIHDWTQVEAGISYAFHHDWITEIARALNRDILPSDHYALPEQHAAGFGPDVLTLQQIHLLIVDLLPPGRRDPESIHGEIWEEIAGEEYVAPADKPFTLASYESGLSVRAYVVHAALGEPLTDMPLFLEPEQAVQVPLEATYMAAFHGIPRRWCQVLDPDVR